MSEQPKPDSKKYTELISEIKSGHIKVPKFQRDFVWNIEKTANLLDSILKGYPIGTFILWETKERLNEIKEIGNLGLPPAPDDTKIQYVLDGQQRITSLYAAYKGAKIQKEGDKKITDYHNIYVNLNSDIDEGTPIVVSEKPEGASITLNEVLNFDADKIKENYSEHFKKIHNCFLAFNSYDFSTIVLRKEDIDSAIEVFTRINTGGQTLTLFEIMCAKTYDEEKNFDMEDKWQNLLKELGKSNYETISSSVILNVLSLILSTSKECKRKVILQLDKQKIIDTWDDVISALKSSIKHFRSVYRIQVSEILPYDSLLVPFTYFFYHKKEKPNGMEREFLEEFFWRMSLSFRYSSATESKLSQDIKRIEAILKGNRPSYDEIKVDLGSPNDLIETPFSAGSSYCKAILCLLAYHEPKNFQDNGKVILDNSWLTRVNSRNYHHFFPKAYLRKNGIENENSVVNIALVDDNLNKKEIRSRAPSDYIKDFSDENDDLAVSLKSHLINNLENSGIMSDDYNVFLKERANIIFNELTNRIELKHKEDKTQDSVKELILSDENEKFEMKSTLRFDIKTGGINKKLEHAVAKTISAFLNTEGGTLMIGIDDDKNILGLEKDLETLSKKNKDGFELHLRQVIKNLLGESFEKHIKISFSEVDEKEICVIKVQKSGKPVFVDFEGTQKFFVRIGNSSAPKNRQEQSAYEKMHWN